MPDSMDLSKILSPIIMNAFQNKQKPKEKGDFKDQKGDILGVVE